VPPRFIGLSLSINTLLRYIGSAIGPTVAGMLMQTNQNLIKISDGISKAFPSRQSCDFIFMFILILAAVTIFLSVKIMHARVDKISVSKQQEHGNT
jgi:fucose permease